MEWSYGVTTVESRFATTLPRTLASLATGGFDSPRLFVDDDCPIPPHLQKYQITQRKPRIRSFMNWWMALLELYGRNPSAERYAIFQDDFVTCRNLRLYLERAMPDNAYLNLYTFPENEKIAPRGRTGWFQANQLGKGAVALVFDSKAVKKLLASQHFVDRVPVPRRGWKAIDGAVVTAAKKAGMKEFCHLPSLVQHIGKESSMGNRKHAQAPSFRGEDFDVMTLTGGGFAPVAVRKSGRVGLVGYNCASGLGEVNRQIASHVEIDSWLVYPHKRLPTLESHPDVDTVVCRGGSKVIEWLRTMDAVIFAETPYYDNLIDYAGRLGVKTFCVPMAEWLPSGCRNWAARVDRFLSPTQDCHRQIGHVVPSLIFPWPVDTARFEFRQRETCGRFVFINGHGGHHGRKGGEAIRELIRRWPEIPLTIYDQTKTEWGVETFWSVGDNREMYARGDVLLLPHAVDGIGLEALEAAVSGMPVISTDGAPWNEFCPWAKIRSQVSKRTFKRPVDFYAAEPSHLEQLCRERLGIEIAEESRRVRAWAESRSWANAGPVLTRVLRGEIPDQRTLDLALAPPVSAVA